jgi:hypothetical protein
VVSRTQTDEVVHLVGDEGGTDLSPGPSPLIHLYFSGIPYSLNNSEVPSVDEAEIGGYFSS